MHRARLGRRSARPFPGGLNMHLSSSLVPSTLALALAVAVSTPAGAQTAQAEIHIDVATHTVPGMAGLGALGRVTGALGDGNASYGMARHRSEERRVGKEGVSTCSIRGSPYH